MDVLEFPKWTKFPNDESICLRVRGVRDTVPNCLCIIYIWIYFYFPIQPSFPTMRVYLLHEVAILRTFENLFLSVEFVRRDAREVDLETGKKQGKKNRKQGNRWNSSGVTRSSDPVVKPCAQRWWVQVLGSVSGFVCVCVIRMSVCLSVCLYVCMYVCLYVHVYICMSVCVHACMYYTYIHSHMCVHVVCMCVAHMCVHVVCMCVAHIYLCMCVRMYVCVSIHARTCVFPSAATRLRMASAEFCGAARGCCSSSSSSWCWACACSCRCWFLCDIRFLAAVCTIYICICICICIYIYIYI